MLTYSEAVAGITAMIHPLPAVRLDLQTVRSGQVLAETVMAQLDLPPTATAARDGFAFSRESLENGGKLQVVGFVPAGQAFSCVLQKGEAVRIMTGAPLPDGSDTVVPLEGTEQREGQIKLIAAPSVGAYVRQQGEDFRCGDRMLAKGTLIDAGAIGLLAPAGIQTLKIYPRPQVAILATGDELIRLDENTRPNTIIGSNAYMLEARLREEGVEPLLLGIAQDHPRTLEDQIARGLCTDLLITTGGVSTGDRDLVKETLSRFNFVESFSKVAIRPGKSTLFGTVDNVPVFGLPGNPNAAAVTFELFVRPALRRLSGYHTPLAPCIKAVLAGKVPGGRKYQQFLWGRLGIVAGKLNFYPTRHRKSGLLHDLPGAEALLPVAEESPGLAPGSEVEIMMLRLPGSGVNRAGADQLQKY